MKELINAVIIIVSIYGGTVAMRRIHDFIRDAAVEKAYNGVPPLTPFATGLTRAKNPTRVEKDVKLRSD